MLFFMSRLAATWLYFQVFAISREPPSPFLCGLMALCHTLLMGDMVYFSLPLLYHQYLGPCYYVPSVKYTYLTIGLLHVHKCLCRLSEN